MWGEKFICKIKSKKKNEEIWLGHWQKAPIPPEDPKQQSDNTKKKTTKSQSNALLHICKPRFLFVSLSSSLAEDERNISEPWLVQMPFHCLRHVWLIDPSYSTQVMRVWLLGRFRQFPVLDVFCLLSCRQLLRIFYVILINRSRLGLSWPYIDVSRANHGTSSWQQVKITV